MARTHHTTTIEDSIWNDFKEACSNNGKNMNELIEEFMKHYIEGYNITFSKGLKREE